MALACAASRAVFADGKVVPPRNYKGSLEEKSQEAIIIFHSSTKPGNAMEDLILKIRVEGAADNFAWVIPFPNKPEIKPADPNLFPELFNYVEARRRRSNSGSKSDGGAKSGAEHATDSKPVEVLSREIIGDYDVSVVREREAGGLNPWLEKEGYQSLEGADEVLKFYRDKDYVFACVKFSSEALVTKRSVESNPLRFTFATGGRDGVYFPMRMTGLQNEPFDVNLYVFYRFWLNDKLSQFGYRHRGFTLNYRDWDTPQCEADGGKAYSLPDEDPFLANFRHGIPTVTKLMQTLHPGEKYYLTNIQARRVKPEDIRQWRDDLWLFPYYTDRGMIPYDARPGAAASAAYPNVDINDVRRLESGASRSSGPPLLVVILAASAAAALLLVGGLFVLRVIRNRRAARAKWEQFDYGNPQKG